VAVPASRKVAEVRVSLSEASAAILRSDPSDAVFFQVLGARGEWIAGDRDLPVPDEARAPAGEVRFRDDEVQGQPVRVAYLWLAAAGAGANAVPPLVQVAETLDKRAQLTTEIARGVMLSQFAILPLAVLLVWFAVLRGFRPLNELQRRIRQRASDDLSPIDERLAPEEVSPLVAAINDLLGGHVDFFCEQVVSVAEAAKSGVIKAYAVSSDTPSPALPGVTTVAVTISESGSIATWPLYPSKAWWSVLWPWRASGSNVEMTRSLATFRAILIRPSGPSSRSWPRTVASRVAASPRRALSGSPSSSPRTASPSRASSSTSRVLAS